MILKTINIPEYMESVKFGVADYGDINPNENRECNRLYLDVSKRFVYYFTKYSKTPLMIASVFKKQTIISKHQVDISWYIDGWEMLDRTPRYIKKVLGKIIRETFGLETLYVLPKESE